MDQWEIPAHRSLFRPILMMGAEREPIMMLGILAGVFVFSFMKIWAAVVGVLMWSVGSFFLQRVAQKDPHLSRVFFRSLKYTKCPHLPSAASPFAPTRTWSVK